MSNENRSTTRPSRRAFLGGAVALGAALALPVPPAAARTDAVISKRTREFRTSLSVSPFTDAVLESVSPGDGHRRAYTLRQMQELFNRHGATEVYVRVATLRNAHLGDAEYGFAHAVERAYLARDLGMPLNPELGMWSVYGDIRNQPGPDFSDYPSIRLPAPWISLTLPEMETAFRQYGALAAQQILSTGVHVNYWIWATKSNTELPASPLEASVPRPISHRTRWTRRSVK